MAVDKNVSVKICTKCKIESAVTDFHKDKNRKDGLCLWCKPCSIANATRYYRHGPVVREKNKKFRPKISREEKLSRNRIVTAKKMMPRKYGISYERYLEMYLSQNGRCLICSFQKPRLAIDHCHRTGVVRGLLCKKCNSALGLLNDDAKTAENAAEYLSNHGTYQCPSDKIAIVTWQ